MSGALTRRLWENTDKFSPCKQNLQIFYTKNTYHKCSQPAFYRRLTVYVSKKNLAILSVTNRITVLLSLPNPATTCMPSTGCKTLQQNMTKVFPKSQALRASAKDNIFHVSLHACLATRARQIQCFIRQARGRPTQNQLRSLGVTEKIIILIGDKYYVPTQV